VTAHAVEAIILVLALLLAAMSAAAETAFTALSAVALHNFEERGGVGKVIAHLRRDPNRFLTTILMISSSSLIVASSMATLLLTSTLPKPWGEILATVGISLFVLVFAELTPKNLAVRKPSAVALSLARPVQVFAVILSPLITATGFMVGLFMRPLGQGGGNIMPMVSEDEVRATLTLAEQSGGIDEEETDRIEGVLNLDRISVGEVMKPRVDMIAVPMDMPLLDALDVILRSGHSRIPVYEESPDRVVGILYDKDLLGYLREEQVNLSLKEAARDAIFVPESRKAGSLLQEFQRKKVHMAIVVDEYGGTAGLVTIEDLLEEIVGEIQDEYDEELPPFTKESEDQWVFDAMLRVEEVNEEMDLDLVADNGIETLGGYVYERLGDVPDVGASIQADHVRLEVTDVEGKRIKRVRITKLPAPEEGAETAATE
jgi:putative hemolysin